MLFYELRTVTAPTWYPIEIWEVEDLLLHLLKVMPLIFIRPLSVEVGFLTFMAKTHKK